MASPSSSQNPVPSNGGNAVFSWSRDGGIAGFCDELKISATGGITASSCRSPGSTSTGTLAPADLARLNRWRAAFGSVSFDSKDSPAADAMTLKFSLQGTGGGKPTDAERREMLDWAQSVYSQKRS